MKVKIGDVVKVVDAGKQFSSFRDMATLLEVKNWKYGRNLPEFNDVLYRVLGFKLHFYDKNNVVVYIEDITTGKGYLIGHDGIELVIGKFEFLTEEDVMI